MAKCSRVRGSTSNIFHVFAQDSASTTGAGKASIAYSSWACRYIRDGETLSGAITPEDITTLGTYAAPTANTNIRIKAVDNTNAIGIYEIQVHNDWLNATNSCKSLVIYLTATGVATLPLEIELTGMNQQDGVRAGLTALPNAAAEAAGGLFTRGTGAGQINQAANGQVDVNTVAQAGTTLTARDIGASVLLSSGTGTGQVSLSSGAVTAGTVSDKTGYSLAAGQLAFKKNVAFTHFVFPMFDSAGALKSGLTVTTEITKDGGSFAALADSATEIGTTGFYDVDFAQAETNANAIGFKATASGAVPTCYTILTQA